MIRVTSRAKRELQRLLDTNVDWPGARLRLMDRGTGDLGLGIDIEMPGDRVVEHGGEGLLVIDAKLAARLKSITLDVEEGRDGVEIVISSGKLAATVTA
ncbi:hypothetical protein ACFLW1_02490 [Chloroflexota bacterium]